MKFANNPFSLECCLVFGFLFLDGQRAAATERMVDSFRCWGCGLLHQLLTLLHAKQGAKVGMWHLPFMKKVRAIKEAQFHMMLPAHSLALTTVPLISCIKHFYPSRGSWLLQCLSCDEITSGQMAFFTALAGLQPVLRAAVLHKVLPCLPVHQHDRKSRLALD